MSRAMDTGSAWLTLLMSHHPPPHSPDSLHRLSKWVSSRGAHVGLRQRTYREHAVATGGFALFLLKPTQEGRVEGVGPVQAEVAGHRVEATEQVSAEGHPHGDTVW